jgi:chromosome segregation ATPase
MSDENNQLDELKKVKADLKTMNSPHKPSEDRQSLPAWLWWSMGILLGCISVVVLAANYRSVNALSSRNDEVERKEALLLDYETRLTGLKEQVSELMKQRDALKETTDNLQAEFKTGATVIANYRIMKEEFNKLSEDVSTLKEKRKHAIDEQEQLDGQVTTLRVDNVSLMDSITNNYTRLNQIQTALAAAEKSLNSVEDMVTQKKQDLSDAEQSLQLAESKHTMVEAKLNNTNSQQEEGEKKVETLNAKIKLLMDKQAELERVSADLLAIKEERQSLEKNITEVKDDLSGAEEKLAARLKEISSAKHELASINEMFTKKKQALSDTEQSLQLAESKHTTMEAKLNDTTSQQQEGEKKLETLNAKIMLLMDKQVELEGVSTELLAVKTEKRSLEENIAEFKGVLGIYKTTKEQLSQAEQELADAQEDLTHLTDRIETLKQESTKLRSEVKRLESDSDELKAQIAADKVAVKNLNRVKDDLSDAEAKLAGRQKEISFAEQELASIKKEIAVAGADLKAANRQRTAIINNPGTE